MINADMISRENSSKMNKLAIEVFRFIGRVYLFFSFAQFIKSCFKTAVLTFVQSMVKSYNIEMVFVGANFMSITFHVQGFGTEPAKS